MIFWKWTCNLKPREYYNLKIIHVGSCCRDRHTKKMSCLYIIFWNYFWTHKTMQKNIYLDLDQLYEKYRILRQNLILWYHFMHWFSLERDPIYIKIEYRIIRYRLTLVHKHNPQSNYTLSASPSSLDTSRRLQESRSIRIKGTNLYLIF